MREPDVRRSPMWYAERSTFALVTVLMILSAACTMLDGSRSSSSMSAESLREVEFEGGRSVFKTERMTVEIDDGAITRIFNRLTGTEFILTQEEAAPDQFTTGLVYVKPMTTDKGEERLVPNPMAVGRFSLKDVNHKGDEVEYIFDSDQDAARISISYALDPETGDLLVTQTGTGEKSGLSAIQFGFGPVKCRGNLLLPVFNGIKGGTSEYELTKWNWPSGWPIPVAIFDDAPGGLWVHAQDRDMKFKAVNYKTAGPDTWHISFETENFAPFMPHKSVESVTWRINVYEGDWTVPMDQYREWAYDAYDMESKEFARPDWVDDIRLEIKEADYIHTAGGDIEEYLDLLAEHANPSQTLIYMHDWIGAPEPLLPWWEVSEEGAKFNQEARKRGFRTLYYANCIGLTANHPRFKEFEPYVGRDPNTHKVMGWNLNKEYWDVIQVMLYYVSPSCKAWRDFQVKEFKELFEVEPADGLFIDQSYIIYNDDNGLIDGQTTIEGQLEYLRQLAEALPGAAIGGEGINEITFQYESFYELQFLQMVLEDAPYDRLVPMMSRFYLPHTRGMGWLGFPEAGSPGYEEYRDAVRIHQCIPTLKRPSMKDLRNPDSEVRRVIREAMGEK